MKNSESFDAQREPSSYSSKSNSLFANERGTEKTFFSSISFSWWKNHHQGSRFSSRCTTIPLIVNCKSVIVILLNWKSNSALVNSPRL